MKITLPLFLLFFLVTTTVGSQTEEVLLDFHDAMGNLYDTPDPVATFQKTLAPLLAKRRANGPVDSILAHSYHKVSLFLKDFAPTFVLPYTDTAIQLRIEAQVLPSNIAQSHYERGRVLTRLGYHQAAIRQYQVAVSMMSKELVARDSLPNLANRLGYFLKEAAHSANENGNVELGHLWLDQIPQLLQLRENAQTAYEAAVTRGDIYSEQGYYQQAIRTYQRAAATPYFAEQAYGNDQGALHFNWAVVHNLREEYDLAEAQIQRSLAYYAQDEYADVINIASAYSGLIRSLNGQNRYDEVPAALAAGLRYAAEDYPSGKGPVIGELYARAAITATWQDDFDRADSLLTLAATALLDSPSLRGAANLPILAGATIYGQEDMLEMLTAKRAAYQRAYEKQVRPDGLELALATCYTIDTLLRLNRSRLSLSASLGQMIRKEVVQYQRAVDIALQLYREQKEDAYLEAAYQFAANQKSNVLRRYLLSPGLAASLGVPQELITAKTALEFSILTAEKALQNAPPAEEPSLRDSLLRLHTRSDQLKRTLAADYPAFTSALRGLAPAASREVIASLAPDQLVIEYFLGADSIYVFGLSQANGLRVRTLARPENLPELIGEVVVETAGAKRLYDLLVAPEVEDNPELTRLQFIPDDLLWSLPFGALKTNNARFLIEERAISFAYAAPLLVDDELRERAAELDRKFWGLGISYADVLFDLSTGNRRSLEGDDLRGIGALPYAVPEVTYAAEVMGGPTQVDEEATKKKFLAEAGRAKILHLAMHGILKKNPLASALVFRGDETDFSMLTMAEILRENFPAELTVLSACHTGNGPLETSEGMLSIGRAFTVAGSRATITSTWDAQDKTTYTILSDFYDALAAGAPKDRALQRAISTYLSTSTKAGRDPKNWGNLVLTGKVSMLPTSPSWPWWLFGVAIASGLLWVVSRYSGRDKGADAGA